MTIGEWRESEKNWIGIHLGHYTKSFLYPSNVDDLHEFDVPSPEWVGSPIAQRRKPWVGSHPFPSSSPEGAEDAQHDGFCRPVRGWESQPWWVFPRLTPLG